MLSPVGFAPGANIASREPFQASSLCDYFGDWGPERKEVAADEVGATPNQSTGAN